MIICSECLKEMTCVKTGVMCLFGEHHAYSGDEFECRDCGNLTINTGNCQPYQATPLQVEAACNGGRLRRIEQ